jgi:hypothetical protein
VVIRIIKIGYEYLFLSEVIKGIEEKPGEEIGYLRRKIVDGFG